MEPQGLVRARGSSRLTTIAARKTLSSRSGSTLSSRSSEYATWLQENNNKNKNNKNNSILLSNRRSRLASSCDIISLPPAMQVMGQKVTIYLNECPSELRRPLASPYTIVHKYKKASYENKCYWAKVYEVEYKDIPEMSANNEGNGNNLQEGGPQTLDEVMMNLCSLQGYMGNAENGSGSKKSFVAATGDVIGLCAEAASAKDAVKALQMKLANSILQCLDEGLSHCLPTKRNYQDILLKDFEADMAKLRIKVLSPPTYHFMKITLDQLVVDNTSGNGLEESSLSNQPKGEAVQD